jgi:hypothetical protein
LLKYARYFTQLNLRVPFTHLQLNLFTCKLLSHCLLFKVHLPLLSRLTGFASVSPLSKRLLYTTTLLSFCQPPFYIFFRRSLISYPPSLSPKFISKLRLWWPLRRLFRLPRDSFYTIPPHPAFHNLRLLAFTFVRVIYSCFSVLYSVLSVYCSLSSKVISIL